MYRVIVVDDEIWSVLGLKKIIQEDSRRFELVYETTDPLDALEQICRLQPDVVFTDVRMSEMSGIELIRRVKQRGIKTEFVVISGFAEFSYVQQALQEGAIDYQLKPFDRATVQKMLDTLYEKLESRRKLRDLDFYALLRDQKDRVPDLLCGRFGNPLYSKLQVVLVFYKETSFQRVVLDPGPDSQSLSLKIGPRKCLYIVNAETDRTDAIAAALSRHMDRIEKAAISRCRNGAGSLDRLIKEAETSLLDSFVYPADRIFKFRRTRRDVVNQLEESINRWCQENQFQKIPALLQSVERIYTDNDMGIEDAVTLWNRTVLNSPKWGKHAATTVDYLDKYELMDRFSNLGEMCGFLCSQFGQMPLRQSGTVNEKFFELLAYIDQNYAQHLSLKDLCSEFYINMSYCCELFQKHKNMTFSQYLTDVRIHKACELMKYQRSTVAEVCDLVGYKDYFYFNKVFKKKMGVTPADYRRSMLPEE